MMPDDDRRTPSLSRLPFGVVDDATAFISVSPTFLPSVLDSVPLVLDTWDDLNLSFFLPWLALAAIARASRLLMSGLLRFGAPISMVSDVLLMVKPFEKIMEPFACFAWISTFRFLNGVENMGLGDC